MSYHISLANNFYMYCIFYFVIKAQQKHVKFSQNMFLLIRNNKKKDE